MTTNNLPTLPDTAFDEHRPLENDNGGGYFSSGEDLT
jgi:hypothetical protein